MLWFWIAAALLSAGAAALVVHRAARGTKADGPANPAMAVYRRQMAELDELAARGVLAEPERRGVAAETGRRLLAAAARPEGPSRAAPPVLILALAALTALGALAIYMAVGAPDEPDQPFARRLASWSDTPLDKLSAQELAALMRAVAARNPGDPGPLYFLAKYELAADQPLEAAQALDRALALAPGRPELWDFKGVVDIAVAGGGMSPGAEADFQRALALDPKAPKARLYLALAKIQGGDVQGGLADWRALLADLAPADPLRQSLAAYIAAVQAAGKLPEPAAGPATPAAPAIQAMIDGLAARLKANPDDPGGWARLVRAYTVLGETDRRAAALAEARRRYATRPDVLKALDGAMAPAQ